jgi:site-specific DNA recombinase
MPVPVSVEPAVFATVQEPLRDHQRHARPSRRGARYLLHGLGQCQHGGYASYGQRLSPRGRQGKPRAYADDRCLGTDAYRFGGERVGQNPHVRMDRLDLAVWREVWALLAHPARLAEAYQRRLQPDTRTKRTPLALVAAQLGKLRQGLARLIDGDAEGLIEKQACEPRITRLRQRIAHLGEPRRHLAEAAALHTAWQLIIGHLEDFAAKVHKGLEEADWLSQRAMIRALVTRVEVDHDQVHVVFRVDQQPGDPDAEKKSLQDCRWGHQPLVGEHLLARVGYVLGHALCGSGHTVPGRR